MEGISFVEHQIMRFTDCSLERARETESLMRTLTDRRLNDMSLLRFEALAREAEAGIEIAREAD